MSQNDALDRPTAVNTTDGRKVNGGRPDGLGYHFKLAHSTAPDEHKTDPIKVASVAWVSFDAGRPVTELWSEVVE